MKEIRTWNIHNRIMVYKDSMTIFSEVGPTPTHFMYVHNLNMRGGVEIYCLSLFISLDVLFSWPLHKLYIVTIYFDCICCLHQFGLYLVLFNGA